MFSSESVAVAVPATSANLGPGFDTLGLALGLEDVVQARVTDGGVTVEVTGAGAGEVPGDESHLIVATMHATFDEMGVPRPKGLALSCHNQIPHARGLGSSSAAIVAGILLARALVANGNFDDENALKLASRIEGHPDNVAPCLLGGFTIAWTEPAGARAVRLTPHPSLAPVVYVPEDRGLTAHARAALPDQVPHKDAAFNAARAALLVHALSTDPSLLLVATEDRLHQPYRAGSMPATATLVASLREAGIPAFVSGAGPSVLALPTGDTELPEPAAGWTSRSLPIALDGGRTLIDRHAEGDPVAAGLPS